GPSLPSVGGDHGHRTIRELHGSRRPPVIERMEPLGGRHQHLHGSMLSPLGGGVDSRAMSEREERDVSVVGRGAHVEGSLVSTGSLWIAGRMTGEISVEGQVTVAPDSEVEADIKAGSINLAGRVNGNLTAPGSVELPAQSL